MEFPIRVNKYLAEKGYCSRREADELIKKGLVKINGKKAKLGDKVQSGEDKVELSKKGFKENKYYAYNKPVGIVTVNPQGEERAIKDISDFEDTIFPIGRLDKKSHGLIIMTNDGKITDKLLNPENPHEKEYLVKVDKKLKDRFFRIVCGGMELENGIKTKPCTARKINDYTFSIILSEGKRHQIRRMCTALNYEVWDLKRVKIMNVKLGKLKPGQSREIRGEELEEFLGELGIN